MKISFLIAWSFACLLVCLKPVASWADGEALQPGKNGEPSESHGPWGGRNFNLQTSPIAFLDERYNGSFEIGAAPWLMLGIKGTTYPHEVASGFLDTTKGYEIGGRATFYTNGNRLTNSWIVRTSLYYRNTTTNHELSDQMENVMTRLLTLGLVGVNETTIDVVDGPEFELLSGYQWMTSTGINFDINVGLNAFQEYQKTVNLDTREESRGSRFWSASPLVEFNIGYAF